MKVYFNGVLHHETVAMPSRTRESGHLYTTKKGIQITTEAITVGWTHRLRLMPRCVGDSEVLPQRDKGKCGHVVVLVPPFACKSIFGYFINSERN